MKSDVAVQVQTVTAFSEDEIAYVTESVQSILRSGWLTLGEYTKQFEREFAEFVGTRHSLAVSSGTSALEIIFRSLNVAEKEVLVPSNTNFATPAAALYAGATVRLVDGGLYLNLEDLEAKLSKKTFAVVIVHIGGYISPEIFKVREMCNRYGALLIEDAAHAHGASYAGYKAGQLGDAAAFSFFPTKVLTTGEGGMITTDRDEIAAHGELYRNQGKLLGNDTHKVMGNSWRMTEIEAAIGLAQLRTLRTVTEYRRNILTYYAEALRDIPGLCVLTPSQDAMPSGYKCIALLAEGISRSNLVARMREKYGIEMGRGVYEIPIHEQPIFSSLAEGEVFPQASDFAERHVCLPVWRTMKQEAAEYVVNALKRELGSR
jgi:perosamine synthetase